MTREGINTVWQAILEAFWRFDQLTCTHKQGGESRRIKKRGKGGVMGTECLDCLKWFRPVKPIKAKLIPCVVPKSVEMVSLRKKAVKEEKKVFKFGDRRKLEEK